MVTSAGWLNKSRASLPASAGDSATRREWATPEQVTRCTRLREADALLTIAPLMVRAEDDLQHIAEAVAGQPGVRVITVVGADGRLVGVIPVSMLIDDIFLTIAPEESLRTAVRYDQALSYARHVGAHTAGDIMLGPVSVSLDATVRAAFERMHRAGLGGLPVTDEHDQVIGYVDASALLLVWLRARGRGGPPRHAAQLGAGERPVHEEEAGA